MVKLLPLSQLQPSIGESEDACRRTSAHSLDEASQGQRPWNRPRSIPQSTALYALRAIQSSDNGGLENSACLGMKNIGKPCAGKLHARFDEGGLSQGCSLLYPITPGCFVGLAGLRSSARGDEPNTSRRLRVHGRILGDGARCAKEDSRCRAFALAARPSAARP